MRDAFVEYLVSWGKTDPNLYLLTGDLGFSVLEPFRDHFPERFINVGISEQNMIGIAAGLAKLGKRVFVYSIVNFATLRCLEQIRNDICYHNANVVIAIVGAGFSYGTHGYTHFGLEDLAAMLPLPNMKVLAPADVFELIGCMNYIRYTDGPCYLRMARGGEPNIHKKVINLGQDLLKPPFAKINLISHGTLYHELLIVKKRIMETLQICVGTFSLPLLKPLPINSLKLLIKASKFIFVFEEHAMQGGLGSLVSYAAAPLGLTSQIYCYGTDVSAIHTIGSQSYMRKMVCLDAENIIINLIERIKASHFVNSINIEG